MNKPSNRFVLFLAPLIFGLREFLFCSIRWESVEPLLTTATFHDDYRPCCSTPNEEIAALSPLVPNVSVTRPPQRDEGLRKHGCGGRSIESTLHSIQRSLSAEIMFTENVTDDYNQVRIRAFPPHNPIPCVEAEADWTRHDTTQRKPSREGLLYVKTHKTGSTTVQGVTVRLAMKMAERHNEFYNTTYKGCKSRFEHWPAYLMDYRNRRIEESFLFAVVRDPTMRAISMFFHFEVSRGKQVPTDQNFMRFLTTLPDPDLYVQDYYQWGWSFDHYLHFLSVDGYTIGSEEQGNQLRIRTVNNIMDDYDFLGVTERLDESLVALQMILGLKTTDILYYSAKSKGSWDDHGHFIQPSFVSEGIKAFFSSAQWKELSKGDYLLYMAANASLDRTIESLGRRQFDQKLAMYRYAKRMVAKNCTNIASMFTSGGKAQKTDCLVADAGCGSQCFDRLEREFPYLNL